MKSPLLKVTSGVSSASYSYLANAPLVSQISFTNNGAWRMTTSKQFDQLNRLQSMASVAPTFTAASFEYTYNNANQRTERREADGVYWRYEYDSLGQVTSGKKYWADGIPVAGQQFEYAFDDIGNRTSTKAGGDQDGANLRSASYSPNLLNQYASRTVPGAVDVMGVALATNTVTVDGFSAYRKGEYFRKELSVVNTSVPVWKSLTVSAPGETPVTRSEFVPKTPELFTHDLDGNLVADGRWTYIWDGENRLVAMAARTGVGPQISLKFEYDAQGRRIRKQVWGNAAWSGSATNDLRFVYDGWNLIAVLSPQSAVLRSFTWGLDLSGSLQGAGGVGGLVAMNVHSGANGGTYFYCFDGNGNVAALIRANDSTVAARYEYEQFGELLRASGSLAAVNPFRFSTKYQDEETGLLYYGYRYLKDGRWLSRDPIAEAGGLHLYAFCANNPVRYIDACGRDITDWTWIEPAANFSAGVGDSLTMGITSWLRGKMDIDQVDYSSGLYYVGEATEIVVETTVTLGSGALVKRSAQFTGKAARYTLTGNYRAGKLKSLGYAKGKVKGGIVHHWNPVRQGRFPLPYRWAGGGNWNMVFLQDGRFLTAGQKHRFWHWYLKMGDTADVIRAWSSPIRSGGNAIIKHVNALGVQQNAMGKCPPGPNLTIEVILSVTFDGYNEAYTDIPDSPESPPLN